MRYFAIRFGFLAAVAALTTVPTMAPAADGFRQDEQTLIEILVSEDAGKPQKAIACKKLAVFGSPKAAEALAPLLRDPEMVSWARIALEAIPGEEVDQVLIESMADIDGRSLIGVINTLGIRGTRAAVPSLIDALQNQDADVAVAAAVALGAIGGNDARQALQSAFASADDMTVRSGLAEGLILVAENAMTQDQADAAAQIYDSVAAADVPPQRKIEAIRGSILSRGSDGVDRLIEALKSDDRAKQGIALTTVRELSGDGATDALVNAIEKVDASRRALLITGLAERGDNDAQDALIRQSESEDLAVRLAAIEGLQRIGDVTALPALLAAADDENVVVVASALETLSLLPDDQLEDAVISRLKNADGRAKEVLLSVVGARRIAGAKSMVIDTLDAKDASIREAALQAIGQIATMDDLGMLMARAFDADNDDAAASLDALRAACVRMPDRDACAEKLDQAAANASTADRITTLELLTAMGGERSLKALADAAQSNDREIQDAATRLLGTWMTVDAAPYLLELASQPSHAYRIRALRGHLRIARQFTMNNRDRLQMANDALKVADREEEKRLILDVVRRYPTPAMLNVAVKVGQDAEMKPEAIAAAAVVLKLVGVTDKTAKALQPLWGKPMDIEIISAKYGSADKQKDVTELLRQHAGDSPLIRLPQSQYNSALGGDPAPGSPKELTVEYKINGEAGQVSFAENDPIVFPLP
ncbi:HEAT repeat domain-containing protein [Crateriforma spongiae]|uniref:HEAT repeat domain-containing protein n=1 Tax=Crateriforma spongiae TaxID=2724528 RepID=UPI0039AF67FB